jgi:hypothetical protein
VSSQWLFAATSFCPRLPLFVCYSHNKWLSSHNHVASSVTAIVSYDTAISQCRKWLPARSKTHVHLGGCLLIKPLRKFPVHIQTWMNLLAVSPFFPWISRSVSKCLWNTGNRWEVNEHLCSWVVESTPYEYELFDDIEFCSRITVLVVSAFISHLCYHAGETPVERICNAVKFIIGPRGLSFEILSVRAPRRALYHFATMVGLSSFLCPRRFFLCVH